MLIQRLRLWSNIKTASMNVPCLLGYEPVRGKVEDTGPALTEQVLEFVWSGFGHCRTGSAIGPWSTLDCHSSHAAIAGRWWMEVSAAHTTANRRAKATKSCMLISRAQRKAWPHRQMTNLQPFPPAERAVLSVLTLVRMEWNAIDAQMPHKCMFRHIIIRNLGHI